MAAPRPAAAPADGRPARWDDRGLTDRIAAASTEGKLLVFEAAELPPLARGKGVQTIKLHRTPIAPELPTVAEAGIPGYEVDQWYGIVTGAKVPRRTHCVVVLVNGVNIGYVVTPQWPAIHARRAAGLGDDAFLPTPRAAGVPAGRGTGTP